MQKNKGLNILRGLTFALVLVVFITLSNWLAPAVAGYTDVNPYYFLSWGAPALFYENIDDTGAVIKLEPWRLLGLQLPAFAGIEPGDWVEVTNPPEPPVNSPVFPPVRPLPVQPGNGVIGIYHSHTSEAFVPTSGHARSTDFSQTVVELGRVIKENLEINGLNVLHREDFNDQVYSQSYINSRKTVQSMLAQEPEMTLLIDLHRDGVGNTSADGRELTTATVAGQRAGQIMFVISSSHGNWQKNQRVANDLHNLMENKYPGLSRGILIRRNATFNQDLHPAGILVEIGGHWNTLDEAVLGAEMLAAILVDYFGGAAGR